MESEEFINWFNSRPEHIQEVIRKFPPNQKYKIRETDLFPCILHSYDEGKDSIEVTVQVLSPFLPRLVFGIDPNTLIVYQGT